jgi:hypothetical protein
MEKLLKEHVVKSVCVSYIYIYIYIYKLWREARAREQWKEFAICLLFFLFLENFKEVGIG